MGITVKRKFVLFSISAIFLFGQNTYAQKTIIDSFLHGGIYRSYRIYIPAINDGSKKVPLVFNLHGLGSNAYEQENYGDFRPIADTANFIVVSPNGTNVILTYSGWNTFQTVGTGTDDLGFINRLLDTVAKRYPINLNRVYATGMSNGGFMSYELACFMSSRIAAIASVAGSMTEERRTSCNAKHATPIMQIHGTADKTVGYDGTNYLSTIPGFTHIDSLMQYWVRYNACSSTASKTVLPNISTADACTAEHYVWSGGKESSSVELFKIIGGGHTWPGSAFSTGVTNQDFSASKEIWRFFSQYSLDQFSLGIASNNLSIDLLDIYPNPVKSILHVRFANPNKQEVSLQLSDMMGRALWQSKTTENELEMPCDIYPSGIYLMTIRNEYSTSVHKIMID